MARIDANVLEGKRCCNKNVIVPRSERGHFDQNQSKRPAGKRLKNQLE
jgi:hypothetical protein